MKKRVLLLLPMLLVMLVVAVPVKAGPLQNFYESPILYWDDQSTGPVGLSWSSTNQTISITGGDASGNLSVGVPVERGESQQIVVMMSVANLSSTVRFEFCDDGTASGQWADVNGTHVVFRDGSYGNLTDEVVLDFFVWDAHNRFWIQAYNDTGIIQRWDSWYGLAGNNWFNMTSTNFNGTLELFYLEGDTEYVTVYNRPEWSKSGTDHASVTQHQQGLAVDVDNTDVDHDVIYSVDVAYLGYVRTECMNVFDLTSVAAGFYWIWNLTVEVGEIRVRFEINMYRSSTHYTKNAIVQVRNLTAGSNVKYDLYSGYTVGFTAQPAKVMFWRTQEDGIGLMYWGSYEDDTTGGWESLWTSGYKYGDGEWEYVTGLNESIWLSDFVIDDWSDCSVTLGYEIIGNAGTDDPVIEFQYNYLEYQYWMASGVAQPHFSSVWWAGDGQDWGGDYVVIEEDQYDNLHGTDQNATDIDPFNPWQWLVDALGSVFDAIGGIIGGALIAIPLLGAALVSTIINLVIPGGGAAFFGTLTDIGAGIVGIFGLIPFLFQVFGAIIGHVTYWNNWLFTYILTAENMLWIVLGLIAIPMAIAAKDGPRAGAEFAVKYYGGAVILIFKAVWTVCTTVLSIIAGFLPGT